jgi:cytochrome c peroxidase
MRLAYSRFSDEIKFFWNERTASLEDQSTRPIEDAVEMGFSGTSGQPDIDSLIRKLSDIPYYKTLFQFVYGDTVITESCIQNALSQFIRSIYSFDSRFDMGLAAATNLNATFQNFSQLTLNQVMNNFKFGL